MTETSARKKAKVFIMDDDRQFQMILAYHVARTGEFEVCGQTQDPKTCMEQIAALQPEIAMVDLMGFEGSHGGVDVIRSLRQAHPNLSILAISMYDPALYAPFALDAGANGYLWKEDLNDKLKTALEKTLNKERFISSNANGSAN